MLVPSPFRETHWVRGTLPSGYTKRASGLMPEAFSYPVRKMGLEVSVLPKNTERKESLTHHILFVTQSVTQVIESMHKLFLSIIECYFIAFMYLFHNNDISELFFVITMTTRSSPITMVICFLCVLTFLFCLKNFMQL